METTLSKDKGLTIGYATSKELYPIYIMSKEYFQYANFSFDEIKRRVDSKKVIYLVGRIDGKLAGYLDYELYEDHAKILGLAVLSEFRGKGIGTALVKKAIEEIKARNYHRIYLFVAKGNAVAQEIYQKEGFRNAGMLERKINEQDVCLFQKDF